jgi:hypothetical protein
MTQLDIDENLQSKEQHGVNEVCADVNYLLKREPRSLMFTVSNCFCSFACDYLFLFLLTLLLLS